MSIGKVMFESKSHSKDAGSNFWDATSRLMSTCKRIFVFAGFIALSCLLGIATPTLAQTQTAPYLDANGWTVFTPSSDTRSIYVSSSTGNDSNSGLSTSTPVKTIAKGLSLMRNGYPDWLLLNKGDTWTDQQFGAISLAGRSATEPMLFSSYGTGARPLLKISSINNPNLMGIGGNSGTDFLALIGIEFYAYTRDPSNPSYNAAESSIQGTRLLSAITWMLIEDCKFSFFYDNIDADGHVNASPDQNVAIRRNVIVDSYGGQGLYANYTTGLLIEENVFDHNGWNASIVGAEANVFNHNMYIQGIFTPLNLATMSGPVTVRGNISANDSSGSQFRSGGTVTNNLWLRNPYPHNIGMPSVNNNAVISNNVYLEGVDPSYGAYGWGPSTMGATYGGDYYNIGSLAISSNIIAHTITHSGNGFGITIDTGFTGVAVTGNIVYDWQSPLINDQGTGDTIANNNLDAAGSNNNPGGAAPSEPFPDPTRSVGAYYAAIGNPGGFASTTAGFLSAARLQSKDNWNPALMAASVNRYIQAGFGISSGTTTPPPSPTADTTPPSVPTGLAATAASSTQVNLAWTASTDNVGVTGYKVFRNGAQVGTTSNTSYQDTGLSAGTAYNYTVSAYDAAGNTSSQSSVVSITTPAAAVTAAPSVTISSPSNGATIKGNGTVNIAVSANTTVSLTITADGNTLATCLNATSCSATWQGKKISQGTHTISGIAVDNMGSASQSVSIVALK